MIFKSKKDYDLAVKAEAKKLADFIDSEILARHYRIANRTHEYEIVKPYPAVRIKQ